MTPPVDKLQEKEIRCRIEQLQKKLAEKNIDGALILQTSDLYYFTGTIQQGHLYVPASGEPVLMVRKDFHRARKESPLKTLLPFSSPKQMPQMLRENGLSLPSRLGMEMDVLPANLFLSLQSLFDNVVPVDISHEIRLVRAVKSPYELSQIRRAAEYSDRLADAVPGLLQEGMTEIALAGRIEALAREMGHQGIVRMRLWGSELFYGHIMSGAAAAVPSYLASPTGGDGISPAIAQGAGSKKVRAREPVLVDFVFVHNGYLSDHTRIFAIGGLPDELLEAQQAMINVQNKIVQEAKPGTTGDELYRLAVDLAGKSGYGDHFMGVGDQRIRFIGHGVGLELDEYPFLAKGQRLELVENMVIALEPKAIFPGKGVVGVENTHVVTADGLEKLGRYPDEVTIL